MKTKKWIQLLLAGWATLVMGLFLATCSGEVAGQLFGLERQSQKWVQAIVMTALVVPTILYLYRYVYRITGAKPKIPEYSWKKLYHLFTGIFFAIALAALGFMIASSQGLISIVQWHAPDQWFTALFVNIIIVFLYEAFPEELGLRGFLFDVLRHRFAAWLAIPIQMLLFISVPISVTLLQVLVGMAPGNVINMGYVILIVSFGLVLQLVRLWSGNIWASIGFHIAHLEIMRFIVTAHAYGAPPILTYHESVPGIIGIIPIVVIIGGSVVSLVILGVKHLVQKRKIKRAAALSN
ncbi:CPBP family intramembrane metalloprotease [Paenibacillus sp. SC116]|uniref:CPBP family intramembrane glutamic endopeptidase n=1 Tax=Paenibacillus sp. SC116 TaxID=2968986 RepID=UPI00215AAAFC|nr:CPBP family intramembrane glutamic endopeptidase [Paenibacillus sp. SC116]MCR8842427.1 CPBP family intramembrane metalloprotease [Paenibacillus sp. SC116]